MGHGQYHAYGACLLAHLHTRWHTYQLRCCRPGSLLSLQVEVLEVLPVGLLLLLLLDSQAQQQQQHNKWVQSTQPEFLWL